MGSLSNGGNSPKKPRKKPRAESKLKGATFERRIAQDMRRIYDPPEYVTRLEAMPTKGEGAISALQTLLKESRVRRSDQGRGAQEPDLVIRGCPLWLELQDARETTPMEKLEQAERDVRQVSSGLLPTAVIHRTGEQRIRAWMRFSTLLYLCGFDDLTDSAGGAIPLTASPGGNLVVMIDYEDLLERLRFREEVLRGTKVD